MFLNTNFGRPIMPMLIGMLEVLRLHRHFMHKETAIFDIGINLVRIRVAAPSLVTLLATETGQWTNAEMSARDW